MDDVEIMMLPPDPDATTVTRITAIVNRAYEEGEKGLWTSGAARTSAAGVTELVNQNEIAVARRDDGEIIGSVRIRRLADGTGEFGMLAADPAERGSGVGRELVRFAEERARAAGATVMRLELLVPLDGSHPVKEFLRSWYTRLGYEQVGATELGVDFPDLAPLLAVPCELSVFNKKFY